MLRQVLVSAVWSLTGKMGNEHSVSRASICFETLSIVHAQFLCASLAIRSARYTLVGRIVLCIHLNRPNAYK